MEQEEIEIQLWEYIDGTCSHDEHARISQLINTNDLWRQKHTELTAFEARMHTELAPNIAPAEFTTQVMEALAPTPAPRSKTALNISIKAVACFFIVITIASLGYVVYYTDWSFKQDSSLPALDFTMPTLDMNLPAHTAAFAGFAAVLLLLVAADTILRKRTIGNL